jgi:twinkle protein
MEDEQDPIQTHLSCDDCGSSDALAEYPDHTFCFSCQTYRSLEDGEQKPAQPKKADMGLLTGEVPSTGIPARGLSYETCRKWDYRVGEMSGKKVQIATYRDSSGAPQAQKVRFKNKDFTLLGEKKSAGLYGQHLWGSGKKLVVTEGEIDAMSVSQAQDHKWPVVSLKNGASGAKKELLKNWDFVKNFQELILLFDQDEPGQDAARDVADAMPPGFAKIGVLPAKDPNELLVEGRVKEIIDAIFKAKAYTPDGVTTSAELKDRLANKPAAVYYPFPDEMPELNRRTYGGRMAELCVITSGTGMGKTTFIKQLQHHFFQSTDLTQAIVHLEEPLEDTAEGLMSMHMGRRIGLPDVRSEIGEEEYWKAFNETFGAQDEAGNDRLQVYDAFGSMDEGNLYNKVRYYAKATNCSMIWIDHLSILVSDMGIEGDERRAIDAIMHNLKNLTVELDIFIGLIVHLKKASNGESFEEGAVPSLDDLRGSGGIKQLSNTVIALSRDQKAESEQARNTSQVHVLKCRFTGSVGPCDFLWFNPETGRMELTSDPEAGEDKSLSQTDDSDLNDHTEEPF